MFETRLGILVQTLIWETSKHGQRGAILLGGRELVRGLRGTRTFHLFHLFCKFPWILAWFGFVGVGLLVCLFLLAFAFGEICFLSSLIPVVDRQCLALVRQCRGKKKKDLSSLSRSLKQLTSPSILKAKATIWNWWRSKKSSPNISPSLKHLHLLLRLLRSPSNPLAQVPSASWE